MLQQGNLRLEIGRVRGRLLRVTGDGHHLLPGFSQIADRRLHIQHLPPGLRLSVRADKYPFLCPDSSPAVGSQLKAFAARLPVTVHQVPQVQLALTAVLRRDLGYALFRARRRGGFCCWPGCAGRYVCHCEW